MRKHYNYVDMLVRWTFYLLVLKQMVHVEILWPYAEVGGTKE